MKVASPGRAAGLLKKRVDDQCFYVSAAKVKDALERHAGQHLIEFTEEPQALEWRASAAAQNA
jgi:hypothetical protein